MGFHHAKRKILGTIISNRILIGLKFGNIGFFAILMCSMLMCSIQKCKFLLKTCKKTSFMRFSRDVDGCDDKNHPIYYSSNLKFRV